MGSWNLQEKRRCELFWACGNILIASNSYQVFGPSLSNPPPFSLRRIIAPFEVHLLRSVKKWWIQKAGSNSRVNEGPSYPVVTPCHLRVCAPAWLCVRHPSFLTDHALPLPHVWHYHMWDVTHSYGWYDLFTRVTWFICCSHGSWCAIMGWIASRLLAWLLCEIVYIFIIHIYYIICISQKSPSGLICPGKVTCQFGGSTNYHILPERTIAGLGKRN